MKFYGPGITGEHIPTISFPTGIIRVLLLDGKDCPISDRGFKQLLGYTGGSADPYSILSGILNHLVQVNIYPGHASCHSCLSFLQGRTQAFSQGGGGENFEI